MTATIGEIRSIRVHGRSIGIAVTHLGERMISTEDLDCSDQLMK